MAVKQENTQIDCRNTTDQRVSIFPLNTNIRAKGENVERLNHLGFYELGSALKRLSTHKAEGLKASAILFDLWQAQKLIELLLSGNPISITVCRHAASDLKGSIDRIDRQYFYEQQDDGNWKFKWPGADAVIEPWQWSNLLNGITQFETIFGAEMSETTTYYVPRRGIFFTPALVDAADEAFPQTLLTAIPEKARTDWKAAGRCLAFNLLSASGFHVARAVEGMLEAYYVAFTGAAPGTTLRSWHDYIQALDTARTNGHNPSPTEKTVAELKQMKDDYRNPIAHPRIVLKEADARMLFANGESLIIGMAQELYEAQNAGQTSLELATVERPPVATLVRT